MLVVPRSAVTRNSTLMTTWQAIGIDTDLGGESADDLARMDIAAHIRDNASIGCKCKNNHWTLLLPQLAQVDNLSTLMRNIASSMSSMQRKQYSLASGENRVQVGFGVGNMSATSSMLTNTVCSSVIIINTVYLKVQVECDGEDMECQLLQPSHRC